MRSLIALLLMGVCAVAQTVTPIKNPKLTGTLDASGLTSGTLQAARGGTGLTSYAIGDLLFANTTSTLDKLAGVATGNALISGGVGTAPSWGKITVAHTTGIAASGANTDITSITGLTGDITTSGGKLGVGTGTIGTNGHARILGSGAYGQVFVDPSTGGGITIQGVGGGGFLVANGNWDGATWTARVAGPSVYFGANNDGGIRFYTGSSVAAGAAPSLTQTFEIFNDKTSVLTNDFSLAKTITAGGTTGAQTINKSAGSVNFAASATSLVVTNNKVTTSSVIVATVATNDASNFTVRVVAAAGSFTLHLVGTAPAAETRVNWIVIN